MEPRFKPRFESRFGRNAGSEPRFEAQVRLQIEIQAPRFESEHFGLSIVSTPEIAQVLSSNENTQMLLEEKA